VKAFLAQPGTFSKVLVLTQNPDSDKAKALGKLGAHTVKVQGAVPAEALKGVDVLVHAGRPEVLESQEIVDSIFKAAIASGVKVYFPPEFGGDPHVGKQGHRWFIVKAKHNRAAREAAKGTSLKVIDVYVGLFTDVIFFPFLGWDAENLRYTAPAPATAKFTITSRADIGKSVARLAVLATAAPTSVSDHVRISGDLTSYKEIAEIVARHRGEKIDVVEEQIVDDGTDHEVDGGPELIRLIKINIVNGDVDFFKDNSDELVNPGQSLWTWESADTFVKNAVGKA